MNKDLELVGGSFIGHDETKGIKRDTKICLKYYKINNIEKSYGIEVVKEEIMGHKIKEERNKIENITKEEDKIYSFIKKLERNKVTPIELNDIVSDRLFEITIGNQLKYI